jgi:hypothetical protein
LLSKLIRWKNSPIILATSALFKKLPNVNPIGEFSRPNSPNLVTLFGTIFVACLFSTSSNIPCSGTAISWFGTDEKFKRFASKEKQTERKRKELGRETGELKDRKGEKYVEVNTYLGRLDNRVGKSRYLQLQLCSWTTHFTHPHKFCYFIKNFKI